MPMSRACTPAPPRTPYPALANLRNVTFLSQFRAPSVMSVTFRVAARFLAASPLPRAIAVRRLDPRPQSAMRPGLIAGFVPAVAVRDSWWGHRPLNLQPRRGRVFDRPCLWARRVCLSQSGRQPLPSDKASHRGFAASTGLPNSACGPCRHADAYIRRTVRRMNLE